MEEKTEVGRIITGERDWKKFPPHPGFIYITCHDWLMLTQLSDGELGGIFSSSLNLG
ncbi:hypothetical protein IC582_020635 [Cucumis melo]